MNVTVIVIALEFTLIAFTVDVTFVFAACADVVESDTVAYDVFPDDAVYAPATLLDIVYDVVFAVVALPLVALCVNVGFILFIVHDIVADVVVPSLHLWLASGLQVCEYVPALVAEVVPPALLPEGQLIPLDWLLPV